MDEREPMAEAPAVAAGHARVVRVIAKPVLTRIQRTAVSGAVITRSEVASAGLLRRELRRDIDPLFLRAGMSLDGKAA